MKVYLLYYDTDHGSPEEWNAFYTPVEVFASYEDREARMDFIRQQRDENGDLYNYEFHTVDSDVMIGAMITHWEQDE